MTKFKDLIKIMPNPTEFYLCIMDEYDNGKKHLDLYTWNRCITYDFKSFSFYYKEDRESYDQNRILELLEYEVTCIRNYVHYANFSNGGRYVWEENQESMYHFFIYIDKPLKKR